ncbi:DUF551 domain-containing protein [Escherichia coli]|uniref:DUF551 domain-containing protein n=1 Tax=Escherichia coli TaxID=562 RepID=UPI000D7DF495|nr:DUF551 domain-containing protein [Escherichia coli]AWS62210.1 hypothetical protein AM464_04240 [Escherichia coli]
MTTITKERLLTIKEWRETYGPGSNVVLPAEEAEELARIALASLEAVSDERAAYELFMEKRFGESVDRRRAKNGDSEYMAWDMALGWIIWCHRAAMPQGSQPVSQTYKLPVNTPCKDAPAHIWLQTAGVWPEDGELSELTWCSHNQHHDDTLYVRADLVNGNSPVTPDGWISCSERMPAQDDWILIYSKHGEYMAGQVQGEYVELSDGTLSWLGNALYWMPLPEPPQEAK